MSIRPFLFRSPHVNEGQNIKKSKTTTSRGTWIVITQGVQKIYIDILSTKNLSHSNRKWKIRKLMIMLQGKCILSEKIFSLKGPWLLTWVIKTRISEMFSPLDLVKFKPTIISNPIIKWTAPSISNMLVSQTSCLGGLGTRQLDGGFLLPEAKLTFNTSWCLQNGITA